MQKEPSKTPSPDLNIEDDLPMENEEDVARGNLQKYSLPTKNDKSPSKDVNPSNRLSLGDRSFKNSQLSASPQSKRDYYYNTLQDFVDNSMKSIALKIAEKKSIELENSSLKIYINKMREELKKNESIQKTIQRNINQEEEQAKKREKENQELAELLDVLKEKTDAKKAEIDNKIAETETGYAQLSQNVEEERNKLESIRSQIKQERTEIQNETRSLEVAHAESIATMEEMKKKIERQKSIENERIKMLRQKSKLLATLIGSESLAGSTGVHKEISKILKTPLKQSMASPSKSLLK